MKEKRNSANFQSVCARTICLFCYVACHPLSVIQKETKKKNQPFVLLCVSEFAACLVSRVCWYFVSSLQNVYKIIVHLNVLEWMPYVFLFLIFMPMGQTDRQMNGQSTIELTKEYKFVSFLHNCCCFMRPLYCCSCWMPVCFVVKCLHFDGVNRSRRGALTTQLCRVITSNTQTNPHRCDGKSSVSKKATTIRASGATGYRQQLCTHTECIRIISSSQKSNRMNRNRKIPADQTAAAGERNRHFLVILNRFLVCCAMYYIFVVIIYYKIHG